MVNITSDELKEIIIALNKVNEKVSEKDWDVGKELYNTVMPLRLLWGKACTEEAVEIDLREAFK
jgi:hypothetical protein